MIRIPTRLIIIVSSTLVETYYTKKPITAKLMAEQYGLSHVALTQSFKELCKSNILMSHRGGGSGYTLLKDPKTLTVADLLIAIEGEERFDCCRKLITGLSCQHTSCDECVVFDAFNKVKEQKYDTLRSITLYDVYVSRGNIELETLRDVV